VRSLAQRSSQAAKDITGLITSSGGQVKEGVELVNRTGAALSDIVSSIRDVAAIVSDIAAASSEQATGIEQVNKALTQMDEVTQQNSALVEENAATAKMLEGQAQAMSERVAFFRLANSSTATPMGAKVTAPAAAGGAGRRAPAAQARAVRARQAV
jgi:methyl-accepting chemotaxis protein